MSKRVSSHTERASCEGGVTEGRGQVLALGGSAAKQHDAHEQHERKG